MKRFVITFSILFSMFAFANGETLSPNMSLVVPAVGVTIGPQWAGDINTSLGIIDSHDHTPGNGVQIPSAGLNINSALSFNGNSITNSQSVNFLAQSTTPSVGSIYENGVDLYYVDGNGNVVRITQGGNIVGTAGSITGLVSPASASYNSGSSTFTFQSAVNTPANLDAGCIILRNLTIGSNGITICPNSSLPANYSIQLPSALPAQQNFLTLDNSGNVSSPIALSGGITGSNLVSSIAIPGKSVSAAGNTVVVTGGSDSNELQIMRGFILSNGTTSSGSGFTSGPIGTGVYSIAFTFAFLDVPACTATAFGSTQSIVNSTSLGGTQVVFTFTNSSLTPLNTAFSFVCIGQRS